MGGIDAGGAGTKTNHELADALTSMIDEQVRGGKIGKDAIERIELSIRFLSTALKDLSEWKAENKHESEGSDGQDQFDLLCMLRFCQTLGHEFEGRSPAASHANTVGGWTRTIFELITRCLVVVIGLVFCAFGLVALYSISTAVADGRPWQLWALMVVAPLVGAAIMLSGSVSTRLLLDSIRRRRVLDRVDREINLRQRIRRTLRQTKLQAEGAKTSAEEAEEQARNALQRVSAVVTFSEVLETMKNAGNAPKKP